MNFFIVKRTAFFGYEGFFKTNVNRMTSPAEFIGLTEASATLARSFGKWDDMNMESVIAVVFIDTGRTTVVSNPRLITIPRTFEGLLTDTKRSYSSG